MVSNQKVIGSANTTSTIVQALNQVRTRAMTLTNCQAGFAAARIWPCNPSKGLLWRCVPQSATVRDMQRPITPPAPAVIQNTVVTLYNRKLFEQAVTTVIRDTTVDRTVRTLFDKTAKALESHSFNNAAAQREIRSLKIKLDAYKKKHKRKQPVNPNLTFTTLEYIQRGAVGPPVPTQAITPPTSVAGTRNTPLEIDTKPVNPFQGVISRLSSIRFS